MSTEIISNRPKSLSLVHVVDPPNRISARELHKYVVGLVGIFGLFAIGYPVAMNRVTQNTKFAAHKYHLKSLTPEYKSIEPQSETSAALAAPVQTPDRVVTTPERTLSRFMKSVYVIVYSPNGELLTASSTAGGIKFEDSRDRTTTGAFPAHDSSIDGIAFSSNGKNLASSGVDRKIKLWNMATAKLTRSPENQTNLLPSLDLKLNTTGLNRSSLDGTVKLWNAR
jgi:WD40 repeat protein